MVNFRYHIVSLVAVFLALGLGVLMGSTVIDQGLVKRLEQNAKGLDGRLTALQAQNDALVRQQDLWDSFGRTSLLPLTKGKLRGRSVVIVSQDGSDARTIDGIAQTLTDAGASIAGRVGLTAKWAIKDDTVREALAVALGVQAAPTPALLQAASERIGERLSEPGDPAAQGDLLAALRDAGFLTLDPTGAGAFPAATSILVMVPSGDKDAKPPQNQFFVPLLRALVAAQRRAAVAETLGSADSLADRVRSDGTLRAAVATVDDADLALGRIALVSALRTLAGGLGGQHYGARRSATAIVPQGAL
jgi:Copper transport outer membrane protein, MctB